ncbi:MAG: hypothetical protein ACRC5V_01280 [Aeromonas sp.]
MGSPKAGWGQNLPVQGAMGKRWMTALLMTALLMAALLQSVPPKSRR